MALEKEDIMALIAILQKGLTDDDSELQYEKKAKKPKAKRSAPKTESKPNRFDEMAERSMHKSDSKVDKLLWGDNKPSARRQDSGLVNVKCRVCGKTEQVNGALAEIGERYKCNKCATTSG